MTAALLLGGVLFAVCVVVGFVLDRWAAWRPRHNLQRLFLERRRERCAANIIRFPVRGGGGCGCREVPT